MQGLHPKTTFLLCNPSSSGGYDIIDHALGVSFPSALMNELQSNGWFDHLQRARTKTEVDLEKIMQLSLKNSFVSNDTHAVDKRIRGDESVFISRDIRSRASFSNEHPMLHMLIHSIESAAFDGLSDHFEFNKDMTSVQLARYPGDSQSNYPRHCDSGAKCKREEEIDASIDGNGRLFTFIYYLTPDDWDAELDGGALRVFYSEGNQKSSGKKSPDYFDVTPFSDRMVIFRSDHVEHEVMPSLRRERVALTIWLYGRSKAQNTSVQYNELPRDSVEDGIIYDLSNLPPPLPLPSTTLLDEHETIFVAIPSYRDSETWPTIYSLLQTAKYPERVYIGVVWQVDTLSIEEVELFTRGDDCLKRMMHTLGGSTCHWNLQSNFRSLTMDYRQSKGPCFARHLAQTLHRGEDYVLQIDSHMRFRPNWDVYLIHQFKKCAISSNNHFPRVVLTAYPPNYNPPHGPGANAETRASLLVPWKFGEEDGMLRQKGRLLRSKYPFKNVTGINTNDNIPCLLFAGGFNFSHSTMLDDCPYDHKLHDLFFGEELSMAVRLYTHGYDLFSPPDTVCYHQWERNPLRTSDALNRNCSNQHKSLRGASLDVVRMQLQGLGRGLGEHRTAKQFSEELGVDFNERTLRQGSENGMLSVEAFADFASTKGNFEGSDVSTVFKLVSEFIT